MATSKCISFRYKLILGLIFLNIVIILFGTRKQGIQLRSGKPSRDNFSPYLKTFPFHENETLTLVEVEDGSLKNLNQSDERILNYIRSHHLIPPSDKPYHLTPLNPTVNRVYRNEIVPHVLKLLNNTKTGWFVECGANDGEFLSNSLPLELEGWTGLLIEADPKTFTALRGRNRKAWISDVCLSTVPYPQKVTMTRYPGSGSGGRSRLAGFMINPPSKEFSIKISSQCFPLFSILSALDIKTVDYFSLDIEGAEMSVLKTFPFDGPILIKVISVEDNAENSLNPTEGLNLKAFMESKGYKVVAFVDDPQRGWVHDYIFVHKSVNAIERGQVKL